MVRDGPLEKDQNRCGRLVITGLHECELVIHVKNPSRTQGALKIDA